MRHCQSYSDPGFEFNMLFTIWSLGDWFILGEEGEDQHIQRPLAEHSVTQSDACQVGDALELITKGKEQVDISVIQDGKEVLK